MQDAYDPDTEEQSIESIEWERRWIWLVSFITQRREKAASSFRGERIDGESKLA